jgi:hypothetical protein
LIREALKERNNWLIFRTFSALFKIILVTGATRLTLFGACPWLLYCAPLALALALGFPIARLWRWALATFGNYPLTVGT